MALLGQVVFPFLALVGSLNSRQLGLPLWAGWIVVPFHRAAGASSQRLSWNRAWGRGSPGARGEGGQRTGSAPRAGRSRAARVGNRVVAGMGGGPSCAPGIPTAAGKAPGAWQGRGGAGRGGGGGGGGGGGRWAGVGEGFPVVLSGVAVAAGNAHCVRSWVPKGRHP